MSQKANHTTSDSRRSKISFLTCNNVYLYFLWSQIKSKSRLWTLEL